MNELIEEQIKIIQRVVFANYLYSKVVLFKDRNSGIIKTEKVSN